MYIYLILRINIIICSLYIKINVCDEFLYLTKKDITDIITSNKMNYLNTNIAKQNKAVVLNAISLSNLLNLSIDIIILIGINLILSLIIIIG